MTYEELIEELRGDDAAADVIRKVQTFLDEGMVPPDQLRGKLRKLYELRKSVPCERVDRKGVCVWLSEKEGPGQIVKCPYYENGDDPRECRGYRPSRR